MRRGSRPPRLRDWPRIFLRRYAYILHPLDLLKKHSKPPKTLGVHWRQRDGRARHTQGIMIKPESRLISPACVGRMLDKLAPLGVAACHVAHVRSRTPLPHALSSARRTKASFREAPHSPIPIPQLHSCINFLVTDRTILPPKSNWNPQSCHARTAPIQYLNMSFPYASVYFTQQTTKLERYILPLLDAYTPSPLSGETSSVSGVIIIQEWNQAFHN